MSKFTIAQLNDADNLDLLKSNPRIIDFAENFNTNFTHDAASIVGAGPYAVSSMSTHQYVKLERKASWWGDAVAVDYIAAYPQTILFKIIDDDNNALMSLKEEEIDVMTYISEDNFSDLRENERALKNFNFYTPDAFSYRYIGMNTQKSTLQDVKVRNALAHLVDKDVIINELCNGYASKVNGPVSPLKQNYNRQLPNFEFDLDRAKELLLQAGWKDSDGDNILDKVIDGDVVDMVLNFTYPQGKQFYKDVATILKDEAERVGIKIELMPTEWSVIQEDLKDRDFDLISLGWGQTPLLDDFKQIWHTESMTRDGSNYVGFGNEKTDRLIDLIRETMDDSKRNEMYQVFQEMVVREHPYIFLVAPKLCMAISKKFKNAAPTSMRPGYWVRLFKLK
jgi:peptide/nickel transport system substrate-binding protein